MRNLALKQPEIAKNHTVINCELEDTTPTDLLTWERVLSRIKTDNISPGNTTMIRKIERKATMEHWQERWTQAAWTRRLLSKVTRWSNRMNRIPVSLQTYTGTHGTWPLPSVSFKYEKINDLGDERMWLMSILRRASKPKNIEEFSMD